MQVNEELIITMPEFEAIKENLKWRCSVGNDPIYCPHGCPTKTEPCKKLIRINGGIVHKCPHKRRFEQFRDSRPLPPDDKKDLAKMAKYKKKMVKFNIVRNEEWKLHFDQCQECGVYNEWLKVLNEEGDEAYMDDCRKYRSAVWKMYLLNSRKARLWNNELR